MLLSPLRSALDTVSAMSQVLVVRHDPTPHVQSLTAQVLAGAAADGITNVSVNNKRALDASARDVLEADGYVLITPVNFGYISGALKHFFDTVYDEVREPTAGRSFSYIVHGKHDATGAVRAITAITTGLGWKLVAEPLVFLGDPTTVELDAAFELSATVAATVMEESKT